MNNYIIFTYATNVVSAYFAWRLWVCFFINRFPGIHRNDFKKLTKESLPIVFMTLIAPIPFVGLITIIANVWNEDGVYFRFRKPKIVMKLRKDVDVGYVPKYLHPSKQNKFLYMFDKIEPHEYIPTPRMIKARSGNFHKQKDNT